uniref:RHS repeat-associated core domain-containing protein n=1 Tax=Stieleria mannarensis TaxID=2755585 RepID=UPI00160239B3
YHYRARMYDSIAGRFCSRDPIGYAGGIGLYTYVRNSAVSLVDPFGLEFTATGHQVSYSEMMGMNDGNRYVHGYTPQPVVKETGNDVIDVYAKPGCPDCFCAHVLKAKQLNVHVDSYIIKKSESVGVLTTERGWGDIKTHEINRVKAYRMLYKHFIKPANSEAEVFKCGTVCRTTRNAAKEALEGYLKSLRFWAKDGFNHSMDDVQAVISKDWETENNLLYADPPAILGPNHPELLAGIRRFHTPDPSMLKTRKPGKCPVSTCGN